MSFLISKLNTDYFESDKKSKDNKIVSDGKDKVPKYIDVIERPLKMHSLLSGNKGKMFKGSNKPVKVVLSASFAITGAAGAAAFGSQALSPIGVQDWTSYAALYDLCRTIAVKFVIQPLVSSSPVTANAVWAVAWDPVNSGSYSTIPDMLTAQKFYGPVGFPGPQNITTIVHPTSFHKFNVGKLPTPKEQIANNNLAGAVAGGGWIATSDTNYIIGYLKSYMGNIGAGLTPTLSVYTWYEVEFKSRT